MTRENFIVSKVTKIILAKVFTSQKEWKILRLNLQAQVHTPQGRPALLLFHLLKTVLKIFLFFSPYSHGSKNEKYKHVWYYEYV